MIRETAHGPGRAARASLSTAAKGIEAELHCVIAAGLYSFFMWIVLTLAVVGAALLLLETILPGLIAGTVGILCLVAAVALGYTTFGFQTGTWIFVGIGGGLLLGGMGWVKYFPRSKLADVFISHRTVGDLKTERPELLNELGVAQTNLRPSGTAVIQGRRVDVVTEGAMIERGTPIKVVAVEGMRIVVRAHPSAANPNSII